MKAGRQTADPRAQQLRHPRPPMRKQAHEFLLGYWAFSFPHRGRFVRTIYIQPFVGLLLTLTGVAISLLRSVPLPVGVSLSLAGLALIGLTYPISRVYHVEYPGRFNPRLEEYVARRVSRLAKDQFIPQFRVRDYSHTSEIRDLNYRVRQALRIELRRLELSDDSTPVPVCGVLVLGPKHSNKTGALWDAMAQELKGWTFVQWPHHMDHPANLARSVGHRVVLWVDDLQDFAHPGEAAALAQFVQQVRAQGRSLMVLSSCRDGQDLHEAEHYFRPLMRDLRVISTQSTLPLVPELQTLQQAYQGLPGTQQSVLDEMSWLKSVWVLTFPDVVLRVLSPFFPHPAENTGGEPRWKDMVTGLSQNPAKFVRVEQLADAQTRLSEESYNFADWLRYNLLNKFPRRDTVIVPINVHYLDLERLRSGNVRSITADLERKPEAIIRALAAHAVAAETLILLGDAYLSRLGEDLDNAHELAIKCYDAAFDALNLFPAVTPPLDFPGAWAAALVGKANAELREGRAQDADRDFHQATQHLSATPSAGLTPMIPPGLLARAWRGQGDVRRAQAAQVAGTDEAARLLRDAAKYYELAAQTLASDDPLWGETQLDRANVLYELAEVAAKKQSEQRVANAEAQVQTSTPHQHEGGAAQSQAHPLDDVVAAQSAYQDAHSAYSRATAPAVWAEIEHRQGKLCLMSARSLLHADVNGVHPVAGSVDASNIIPSVDQQKAIELAKKARNHFVAANEVFTSSFLPMSWSSVHLGLAYAFLILARFTPPDARAQAWDSYSLCLEATKAASTQVSTLMQAPLDWLDLQLLAAEAEIGRAPLDEGGAAPHYREAKAILTKIEFVLTEFARITGNSHSDRMKAQQATMKALSRTLERVVRDS